MSTTADRLAALSAKRDAKQDDLTDILVSEGGYAAYLDTAVEHPTMRPANLAAIARFRNDNNITGWLELLSATTGEAPGYNSVEGLAGRIPGGTPSVGVVFPNIVKDDDGRFETKGTKVVQLYPATLCTHLKSHYKGRPIHVERNYDRFLRASADVDLENLSPAADYVLSKRYGLEPDPTVPDLPDVSDLMAECDRLADELKRTVAKIDANLRAIKREERVTTRQPERRDVPQGETPVPETTPTTPDIPVEHPARPKAPRDPHAIPSTAEMLTALATAEKTAAEKAAGGATMAQGEQQGKDGTVAQNT